MITYVTCDDVDNAFGNAWTSENAKNKAVLMANAWLNGFSLKINPSRIPEEVKLAGAYAARIASVGKLFQQKNDSGVVISKAVSADGVSVSKSFAELPANSTALLEPDLQLAIALLKPYGLSRSQVREEIQSEVAAAFDEDLADVVSDFSGSYVTYRNWDPVTETGGESTATYTGRGVLTRYKLGRIDGINILHGDLKLTALVCEVTDKPAVGHIIEIYDSVSRQLQRYEVITASVDPSASVYSIQLRRA